MAINFNWNDAFSQSPDFSSLALSPADVAGSGPLMAPDTFGLANQVQTVTAGNGVDNSLGDINALASQDTGTFGYSGYGVTVGNQLQLITAANGVGNETGDINVVGDQGATTITDGPFNGAEIDVNVDLSNGVNVDLGVQTFAVGNGVGNSIGADSAEPFMPFDDGGAF